MASDIKTINLDLPVRCLEKNIQPHGGLMMIYHGIIPKKPRKKTNASMSNKPLQYLQKLHGLPFIPETNLRRLIRICSSKHPMEFNSVFKEKEQPSTFTQPSKNRPTNLPQPNLPTVPTSPQGIPKKRERFGNISHLTREVRKLINSKNAKKCFRGYVIVPNGGHFSISWRSSTYPPTT